MKTYVADFETTTRAANNNATIFFIVNKSIYGSKNLFYLTLDKMEKKDVDETIDKIENVIKQIHFLVLSDKKDDRGVYRRVPVRIMGAQHEPAQPYLIQQKMEQLLLWQIYLE